jgi:hypothetical protein
MLKSSATLALILGLASVPGCATVKMPNANAIALQRAEQPVITGTLVVKNEGSKTLLVFSDDFKSNPKAPDLQVVLLKSPTPLKMLTPPHYPLKPGSYTQVATLKSYKGAQSYSLPDNVNIKDFGSVLIWCKRVNATQAWAPLN